MIGLIGQSQSRKTFAVGWQCCMMGICDDDDDDDEGDDDKVIVHLRTLSFSKVFHSSTMMRCAMNVQWRSGWTNEIAATWGISRKSPRQPFHWSMRSGGRRPMKSLPLGVFHENLLVSFFIGRWGQVVEGQWNRATWGISGKSPRQPFHWSMRSGGRRPWLRIGILPTEGVGTVNYM